MSKGRKGLKVHASCENSDEKAIMYYMCDTIGETHFSLYPTGPPSAFPRLDFPPGFQLECLHGQHRIKAGRQFLLPTEKWWIIDLYLSDLKPNLRSWLIEEYSHEWKPTDGEIYQKLRQYDAERDLTSKLRWKSRLKGIRSKSLNTLYKHEDLRNAFDALLDIPGLWHGMKLSTIHKVFPLRCNEEIVHYLSHIKNFWSGLVQGDRDAMSKIDRDTVQALQMRAPRASMMDAKLLGSQIRAGEIFNSFDEPERGEIWSKLQMTEGLIPSIYTLFRDVQYLEDCVNCVKRLTTVSPQENLANAMKRKFTGVNQRQGQLKIQISEDKFIYMKGTSEDQIDYGYRQLHAFAMRDWPDMPKEPEKEDPQMKAPTKANLATLRRFADLATELGFHSDQITTLRQHQGHENAPAAAPQSKPALVTSGKGVPIKNRCGRQTTREFEENRQLLFISNLHDKRDEQGSSITSFFVRKSVYLAFFGEPSTVYDSSWRDESSPSSGPQHASISTPGGAGADFSPDLPTYNTDQSHRSEHSINSYDNLLTLYQQTGGTSEERVRHEEILTEQADEGIDRDSSHDWLDEQENERQENERQENEREERLAEELERERLELRRIEERLEREDLQERLAQRLQAQEILNQEKQREQEEKRREQEREEEEQRRQEARRRRRLEEETRVHGRTLKDFERTKRPHTQIDMEGVYSTMHGETGPSLRSGREPVLANQSADFTHRIITPVVHQSTQHLKEKEQEKERSRMEQERLEQERLEQERLEQERLQSLERLETLKSLEQEHERRDREQSMRTAQMKQRKEGRSEQEKVIQSQVDLPEQITTPARPRREQDPTPSGRIREPVRITFMVRERGVWRTNPSLQVYSPDSSEIERIAVKYMRKGMRLYDIDLNLLIPRLCFQAAIAKGNNLLLLIPETEIDINEELEASVTQLVSELGLQEEQL